MAGNKKQRTLSWRTVGEVGESESAVLVVGNLINCNTPNAAAATVSVFPWCEMDVAINAYRGVELVLFHAGSGRGAFNPTYGKQLFHAGRGAFSVVRI
ncbi:hypothetical protein Dimus_032155, partial [Dionaea muscipula]